jgi:hypothetical protein
MPDYESNVQKSKLINSTLSLSQDRVDKFTYAVFIYDSQNRPVLMGSSVLIRHKDKTYFITAGHLIREANGASKYLLIAANKKFIPLSGVFVLTEPASGTLDLGVIALSNETVKHNDLHTFPTEKILPWEQSDSIAFGFSHGFPLSKNKQVSALKGGSTFHLSSFAYAGKFLSDEALFRKYMKSEEEHSCLSYGKNSTNNIPIKPKGMSGCGVWFIKKYEEPDKIYLESILIEYYKDSKIVFATKAIWVIKLIDQHWS